MNHNMMAMRHHETSLTPNINHIGGGGGDLMNGDDPHQLHRSISVPYLEVPRAPTPDQGLDLSSLLSSVFVPTVLIVASKGVYRLLTKDPPGTSSQFDAASILAGILQPCGSLIKNLRLHLGNQEVIAKVQMKFTTIKTLVGDLGAHSLKILNDEPIPGVISALEGFKSVEDLKTLRNKYIHFPWFSRFLKQFLQEAILISPWDTSHHPFTVICVANSEEEDIVKDMEESFSQACSFLKQFGVDLDSVSKYHLIIHDDTDESLSDKLPEIQLKLLSNHYGPHNCNSITSEMLLGGGRTKAAMNFIDTFSSQCFFPHIQKTVTRLETVIATAKKGVGNKMRSMWNRFGAGKRTQPNPESIKAQDIPQSFNSIGPSPAPSAAITLGFGFSSPVRFKKPPKRSHSPHEYSDISRLLIYEPNSVELSIRRLADILFLLRREDLALSYYRQASGDFKADKRSKALAYYASAQEMIGLVLFLLGKSKEQSHLETAYSHYIAQNDPLFHAHSVRVALLLSAILIYKSRYSTAVSLCSSMAQLQSHPLIAALFYEQNALLHAYFEPPQLRMFCFYLTKATDCFLAASSFSHAYRCCQATYPLYANLAWGILKDHVHYRLVHLATKLGHLKKAFEFVCKLMKSPEQSPSVQSSNFRQFQYLLKQMSRKYKTIWNVPLLLVDFNSLGFLLLDDDPNYVKSEFPDPAHLFRTHPMKSSATEVIQLKRERVAVVGEPLSMVATVTNPFLIPLQFRNVHLDADILSSFDDLDSTVNDDDENDYDFDDRINTNIPDIDLNTFTPDQKNVSKKIKIKPFDVMLYPQETKQLHFHVLPLHEGIFQVKGIFFQLGDDPLLWAKTSFGRNSSRITTVQPVANLRLKIVNFPSSVLDGQVFPLTLELTNQCDAVHAKNIHISFFPSHFFSLSEPLCYTPLHPDLPLLPSSFSPWQKLDHRNDQTTNIPLYFHSTLGKEQKYTKQACRIVVYYEHDTPHPPIPSRLIYGNIFAHTSPTLRLSPTLFPSVKDILTSILHIEIENLHNLFSFEIPRIEVVNPSFCLEPLHKEDSSKKTLSLSPRKTLSLFFILSAEKGVATVSSSLSSFSPGHDMFIDQRGKARKQRSFLKQVREKTQDAHNSISHYNRLDSLEENGRKLSWSTVTVKHEANAIQMLTTRDIFSSLQEREAIDIVLYWTTDKSTSHSTVAFQTTNKIKLENVEGHHATTLSLGANSSFIPPGNDSDLEQKLLLPQSPTVSEDFIISPDLPNFVSPFRFRLVYPNIVYHNFFSNPLCQVNFQLEIFNTFSHRDFSFELECLSHEGIQHLDSSFPSHERENSNIENVFVWAGTTLHFIPKLGSNNMITIDLSALFFAPGIYCLNRFRLNKIVRKLVTENPGKPSGNNQTPISFIQEERAHQSPDDQFSSPPPPPPPPPPFSHDSFAAEEYPGSIFPNSVYLITIVSSTT